MKKFLIFLVSLVVIVCLGLTTFYFMRNNEVITIEAKEIYCNVGDIIPVNSLGIEIKKAKKSKKTTFDYNAGGEDVTKFIEYNSKLNSYVVSKDNAGEVTLVISTSNKKYNDFTINVHIGNGTVEYPYFIFNEADLKKIGSTYRLDKNYILMSDIVLTSGFKPIGYNENTSAWEGFAGSFDGNGHTITGLNLVDGSYANAGLFSTIKANASVKDLTVSNATISGEYEKAGALAGEINGNIEGVAIKNVNITNKKAGNFTGAVAGVVTGNVVKTYADGATINIGDASNAISAVVGGMFGKVVESTIQATYVNNATINATNATLVAGGYAGEFVIGTSTGSIQQSYANVSSQVANFAGFIGKVSTNNFDASKAIMLRHLIGNVAVVYGKDATSTISDTDLVKDYDNTYFKNELFPQNSVFFDTEASFYMIRGFKSAGEIISTNEFVFYAVKNAITTWDTTYVWEINNNNLPTLRMGTINPENPSNEYLLRNLTEKDLGSKSSFISTFSSDVNAQKININEDIDVTDDWTAVAVTNSVIEGNGKTIRVNLNKTVGDNLGLFTKFDNSTIRNLNIVVTGISANASNAGALAGVITSNDTMTSAVVDNVTVTYESFQNPVITNFGGLAGSAEKAKISNVEVNGLIISKDAQITNAGGLVASNFATIQDAKVNATLYADTNIGGVVAVNAGSITGISGAVQVNYNKAVDNANVAGVAGVNGGTIDNVNLSVKIDVASAGATINVGGVAGVNSSVIKNVVLTGDGITVTAESGVVNVGGVTATNNGEIANVNIALTTVGSYIEGKSHNVGGVAVINNGKVFEVLVQSNIYGNMVAGIVVTNNNENATVDEVAIGVYNKESKSFTENEIAGDKYVAGVAVDLKAGSITNVQATSKITGKTNATRSSLVVLLFPDGSSLKNSTINSSFAADGYGTTYREVWTDFASYNNKQEFGYSNGETGDSRFNIYEVDNMHGCMQSVVINTANNGVKQAKASMSKAVWIIVYHSNYNNTKNSSFVKLVDGFNDFSQFDGSFELVYATSGAGYKMKTTKTLTFGIGSVWESNNGISLMFLNNM